jgi:hypothetical protein
MQKTVKNLVLIALFLSQITFAQSPWTREKGKAYVQLGFSGIFFNQAAGKDSEAIDLPADYSDVTLQLYSDYGITSKLEAQLILPFKSLSATSNIPEVSFSESFSGLGNISLGLKYKIMDSNWKLSSGLLFTPKTSQYDDKSGFAFATGFNATTVLPYVTIGSSSGKWYYYGNIGYGYMTNDYSDYFRLNAEVGYNVIPKGHIMITIDTRNIVSQEDAFNKDEKQSFSYSDRQTYNAFGLKLNYEFIESKFGANFSVFGAAGNEYTPLAPSINLGTYVKL